MAKSNVRDRKTVVKKTCQSAIRPKTSSMSKHQKRSYKIYRGQGR